MDQDRHVALIRQALASHPALDMQELARLLEPQLAALAEMEAEVLQLRSANALLRKENRQQRGNVGTWRDKRTARLAGLQRELHADLQVQLRAPSEDQAARDQQELTEQILDQLPIPIFLKDRDGRFLRFNSRFEEFTQRSRAEILGRTVDEFATPRWAAATHEEDELAWSSGRMVTTERRMATFDPPLDVLVSRKVINSGGLSYMLGYFIDISEQRAARAAMQHAVESAEAASRAKSEFLANMSHEIRTPMNGILGMTELVLESDIDAHQRADLLLVKASADALLHIVDDILDFSKIEAGKLDIEEVPFDLRQLVGDTLRAMSLRARQKGLALAAEIPPELPRIMKGDPGRLRQVLLNLVGNAIKFTGEGGVTVQLAIAAEHDDRSEIVFAVRDTGIGVPPEKQHMIFEAFAQVDGSTTREYGGTGLGLAICRRLVILMQGRIDVHSAPGRGSVFSFTVPLLHTGVAQAAPLPPLAVLAPGQNLNRSANDGSLLAGEGDLAPAAPASAAARGGLRVLLAEDNPVNQRLAMRLLEKLGHRVTLVDSGLAVLERAGQGDYDLILMDVQMPGLDGLAATRQIRLRESAQGGHVPIIAMTARAMTGDRERCLDAGMDDYLAKPVDSQQLREMLLRYQPDIGQQLLDWRGALQRLDGDAELLLELAALFLHDGPQLWQDLCTALASGDMQRSTRAAHSLKGVLVNFGAARAVALAEQLSAALHAGQPWQLASGRLEPALQQVYVALKDLIDGGIDAMSAPPA
ncbi:ATP-binding protein [Duganella sp. S19_KUP01_CR8]|uniref:ATP-binding protein n=1 Tax=Duganella sp. S19_KUP01_CR8 TaxID=3025502 RepID=UPI002FCD9758